MTDSPSVKVSGRYQVAVPSAARRQLKIGKGDYLLVDVQDGLLILTLQPTDYVDRLEGLHKEVWKNTSASAYVEEERAAWESSAND